MIITGLYPGDHNIIANQFADVDSGNKDNGKMYFDKANEHYTGLHKWWNANEPIWASASKAGLNFSTFLWSRCDVEWFDVKTEEPKFCENIYKKDESKTLQINIEMAIIHFQDRLANAAIVSVQCFNLMHFFSRKKGDHLLFFSFKRSSSLA